MTTHSSHGIPSDVGLYSGLEVNIYIYVTLSLSVISPNPDSSVPLFHQIVVALKHMIAVGTLAKGQRLPSVKEASRLWHVHFHTVRRAYHVLADEGLLLVGRGKPTTVVGDAVTPGAPALDAFLAQVLREAHESFGLSPEEFVSRLEGMTRSAAHPGIYMIECTEEQAAALAEDIRRRWNVETAGWALERPGEPPQGLLVSTFFHFQDVRRRWPGRLGDMHFIAIHPDPELGNGIRTRLGRTPAQVLVCELEAAMADNVAADLRPLLSPMGVSAEPCVVNGDDDVLEKLEAGAICLFAPRVWGGLPPRIRQHPGAFETRYCIRPPDLQALGSLIGARADLARESPTQDETSPPK